MTEHKFSVNANGLWVKDTTGAKTVTGGIITCMVMVHPATGSGDAGVFYLNDGTIVGVNGFALYNAGQTYIGTDGAMKGNYSDNLSCLIVDEGECFVNSGTIAENTSKGAVIIHSDEENEDCSFTNYGKIINNTGTGLYIASGSLIVGGSSNVTGNIDSDGTPSNIVLTSEVIQFDENVPLNPNASMGVQCVIQGAVTITEEINELKYDLDEVAQHFFADEASQTVHCYDGALVLFSKFATEEKTVTGNDGESITVESLSEGVYCLVEDYTTDQILWIEGNVVLCTNGYELHADHIVVCENAEFNVIDCTNERHYFGIRGNGLWVEEPSRTADNITILGGIITCPVVVMPAMAESQSTTEGVFRLAGPSIVGVEGPAIYNAGKTQINYGMIMGNCSGDSNYDYVIYNEGTFINLDGIITENTANIAPIYNEARFANFSIISFNRSLGNKTVGAGAAYNTGESAEFNNLGYIHHNTLAGTPAKGASAIYNDDGASILNWRELYNNTAITSGSAIHMESGTLEVALYAKVVDNIGGGAASNICLGEDVTITVMNNNPDRYLYSSALMGIQSVSTTPSVVVMENCTSDNILKHFFADKETQGIRLENGKVVLVTMDATVEIALSETVFTYTGTAIEPEVLAVKINGEVLDKEDYKVSYANNQNAGTALVNVTFLDGDYEGVTVGKPFTIERVVIDSVAFDITAPKAGAVPAETITLIDGDGLELADKINTTGAGLEWTPYWSNVDHLDEGRVTLFQAGNQYNVAVDFFFDNENYELADSITATVNGVTFKDDEQLNAKGYAVVINPYNPGELSVWFKFDRIPYSYYGGGSSVSAPVKEDAVSKYSDLDTDAWYYEGVAFCIENGILTGYPDGSFQPNTATSRAMIAAILWRLEGCPAVNYAMDYKDVKAGDWYAEAVRWAAAEQVATGYGNGVFGPNDVITREQLAAMLHNYAIYKGYDVSVGENTNILSYDDVFDISDWAYSAMQWACGSGMINGIAEGLIGPTDTATRAQTAVMLKHYIEQNKITMP